MIVKFKNNNMEFEIDGNVDEIKEIYSLIKEINQAKEIVNDSEDGKRFQSENIEQLPFSTIKRKQGTVKISSKLKIVDLNIKNEREFIEEFRSYALAKSITQKIYVLVYLYKQYTGEEIINADIVNSLLNFAQIDTPKSLKQMLRNFVNQEKTFNKIDDDLFKMKFQTEDDIKKLKQQ